MYSENVPVDWMAVAEAEKNYDRELGFCALVRWDNSTFSLLQSKIPYCIPVRLGMFTEFEVRRGSPRRGQVVGCGTSESKTFKEAFKFLHKENPNHTPDFITGPAVQLNPDDYDYVPLFKVSPVEVFWEPYFAEWEQEMYGDLILDSEEDE